MSRTEVAPKQNLKMIDGDGYESTRIILGCRCSDLQERSHLSDMYLIYHTNVFIELWYKGNKVIEHH